MLQNFSKLLDSDFCVSVSAMGRTLFHCGRIPCAINFSLEHLSKTTQGLERTV